MLKIFEKYDTDKSDVLNANIIYPKKVFNLLLTDEAKREQVLSKIISLCITYDMDIVEPETEYNPLMVYSILFSGDKDKLDNVVEEMQTLFNFKGVQIIGS